MNRSTLLIVSALLIVSMIPFINTASGDGAPDIDLVATWTPTDPVVGDPLNISLSSNKSVQYANVSYCLVNAGTCSLPYPMANDGTDMQFYFDYDEFEFPNDTADFHIDVTYDGGKTTYKQFFVTYRSVPQELILSDLAPVNGSLISLFPNQTTDISGHLEYDLDTYDLQSARINLSIRDSMAYNITDIDVDGNFTVGMLFADEGNYIMDLRIMEDDFGLSASGEWNVDVSTWPKPAIDISAEIDYDPLETPPGTSDVFYRNASVNASYTVSNSGTGMANNLTINISIENTTQVQEIIVGNLSHPDNRYIGIINLDANITGNFTLRISVEWDQMAPFQENFTFPLWAYDYSIIEPPLWEPHTVLVEMFTQSDCAPCVFVEEALERLLHEGEKFELITYALDDDISTTTAQARGVSSTPHIFIDFGIKEIIGGDDTETAVDEISEAITEAARRDTPPAIIDFTEIDSNVTSTLFLPGTAREPISGTFIVYRIEEYSNLRNHQGIPMTDRFMGEIDRDFIDNLQPGEWLNLTIDDLAPGEAIVAVYYGEDGNVLQSSSFKSRIDPEIYLAKASTWLKIDTPGTDNFNITIDLFKFHESDFDPVDFEVSLDKIIPGIVVKGSSGGMIDMNWTTMTFKKSDSDMEIKPSGRIRYLSYYSFTVDIPDNLSGTFSFKIKVRVGPKLYTNSVAVTATPLDDNTSAPLEILDYHLIGEGQNIFFVVNATGIPDDASLHGRILPCLDDSGVCGVPVEILLLEVDGSPGSYRGSVVGIDINQYTHFTYYVWVESQGIQLIRSEDVKVEIGTLIDIGENEEPDEDDNYWILMVIGLAAIILLILVVVVFVLLTSRKGAEEPESVTEQLPEPPIPESTPTDGGPEADITIGDIPGETEAQAEEPDATPVSQDVVGTGISEQVDEAPVPPIEGELRSDPPIETVPEPTPPIPAEQPIPTPAAEQEQIPSAEIPPDDEAIPGPPTPPAPLQE